MAIKYFKYDEIDKTQWNNCVENSANCMVYGMSWYLDIVCENWDALILDNYTAVMPLPWKSKFGIKYIYHPFFAQQLGLFYQNDENNKIDEFIDKIPGKFLKYHLSINHKNKSSRSQLSSKKNFILNLNTTYEELYASFPENTKRNIKKGNNKNPNILDSITINEFLELKRQNSVTKLNQKNYDVLNNLFNMLIEKGHGKILGIKNTENELLGAALFVRFGKRIIYLFSGSTEEGKNLRVMFSIVNKVITENANQNISLDFEGSMIEGIARFFKGFGAILSLIHI